MNKILIFLFFCFICSFCFSQNIDTIYISPEPPSTNDNIIFISQVTGDGIDLDTSYWQINDNNIHITMKYYETGLAVINTIIDTIYLGTLQSGSYTLYFSDTIFDSGVASSTDADTILFDVNPNSINSRNHNAINIYPNPVNRGVVFIDSEGNSGDILKVEILNQHGAVISQFYENKIFINDLSNGTFILKIYYLEGVVTKKIIKL